MTRQVLSSLVLPDGSVVDGAQPKARVHRQAAYSLPNSAWTKIPFDTLDSEEGVDTSQWDSANSRLICREAGTYWVAATIGMASGGAGIRGIVLWKNGGAPATQPEYYGTTGAAPTGITTFLHASALIPLILGDYVETAAYPNSTAALATSPGLGWMYMHWAKLL
jgi:hypothetical protein